jgi:hypothetical protein
LHRPGRGGTGLWASARFPGFAGPLVGFTVEFLVAAPLLRPRGRHREAADRHRHDRRGHHLGGGDVRQRQRQTGRIREPAVLNRWAGLKVRLVRTVDGAVTNDVTVKVTANHDDTLFLPDVGFTIDEHTTYALELEIFGAVYHVESGEYVSTADAGDDPRNPGTNPFLADPTRNLEDHYTEYGLPQPNDVTFGMLTGWQQLYDAINVLTVAPGPHGQLDGRRFDPPGRLAHGHEQLCRLGLQGPRRRPGRPRGGEHVLLQLQRPRGVPGRRPASAWQAEVDYNYVSGAWSGPRWFGAVNRWQNTYR